MDFDSFRTSMASLCDTMRRQILSRAFYGWLAYCRHLKTVRLHLTSLVYPMSNDFVEIFDDHLPLTEEIWTKLFNEKNSSEIFRRIYSAGCDPQIRRQVWPFIFSHYAFDSTVAERNQLDENHREKYTNLVEQWRNAEEIIVKNAARRKTMSMKTFENDSDQNRSPLKTVLTNLPRKYSLNTSNSLQRKDSNISNDVFYEVFSPVIVFHLEIFSFFFFLIRIVRSIVKRRHPRPSSSLELELNRLSIDHRRTTSSIRMRKRKNHQRQVSHQRQIFIWTPWKFSMTNVQVKHQMKSFFLFSFEMNDFQQTER